MPLRRLATKHPNAAAFAFGLLLLLLLLAGIEAVCWGVLKRNAPPPWEHDVSYYMDDPVLGKRMRANNETHVVKQRGGDVAFTATYRTDAYGRRLSPVPDAGPRPYYALFFGCSFAFGVGVEDGETLPAQFGEFAPEFQPYNYAVGAYGPQHTYLQLQEPGLADQVPQDRGVLFYVFIDHHVLRLIGSMSVVQTWGYWLPRLKLNDGSLQHQGLFGEPRSPADIFRKLIWRSNMVRALDLDFPALNERHLDQLAQVLVASRENAREQFGDLPFYVVIFPEQGTLEGLREALARAGLDYIDLFTVLRDTPAPPEAYWLADSHPTAQAHRLVAAALARELAERHPALD